MAAEGERSDLAAEVRREVARGIEAYLAAAADPEPTLRDRAAHLLGTCATPPNAALATTLRRWFEREPEERVKASVVFAVGATDGDGEASAAADALPVLEAALRSQERGSSGATDELVANDEAWTDACDAAVRRIRA